MFEILMYILMYIGICLAKNSNSYKNRVYMGDYCLKMGRCPKRVLSHNIGFVQGYLDAADKDIKL